MAQIITKLIADDAVDKTKINSDVAGDGITQAAGGELDVQADGGTITTKPYFSGSSYVRKMSHYKQGPWCEIWDGLYWRWIWNHRDDLGKNPRWAMMCSAAKKMDSEKRDRHLRNAEEFLKTLP